MDEVGGSLEIVGASRQGIVNCDVQLSVFTRNRECHSDEQIAERIGEGGGAEERADLEDFLQGSQEGTVVVVNVIVIASAFGVGRKNHHSDGAMWIAFVAGDKNRAIVRVGC